MAYPYVCTPCLAGEHENCQKHKDIPPPESGLIGGGHCICRHEDKWSSFEKNVIKNQLGNIGEDE